MNPSHRQDNNLPEGQASSGAAPSVLTPERQRLLALRLRHRTVAGPGIARRSDDSIVPASYSQQALWFLDGLLGPNSQYNSTQAVRLRGVLDVAALERSFQQLVERHEILRTAFEAREGMPVQRIVPAVSFHLPVIEVSAPTHEECEQALDQLLLAGTTTPFDLSRAPLLRAQLLQLNETEHALQLVVHHIVSDGWSMGVMARELSTLYTAFVTGETASLPPLPVQFADYSLWQRDRLRGEWLATHLSYWRERLEGLEALELPTDHLRPAELGYAGSMRRFTVPADLVDGLKALARRENVTLFMVLLAAFQVLLMRYSGQHDVVVGSPVAGRNRTELEGLVGYFVNSLVLRTDLSGNPSFVQLLARVRKVCLDAYAHQELPFDKLVAELSPQRDLSRNPLYQVNFALQNMPPSTLHLRDLRAEPLALHYGTAKFDLSLSLSEESLSLAGTLEYSTELFETATIERMARHFQRLLEGIVAHPEEPVHTLPLLTPPEELALQAWNAAETDYPKDQTLVALFERQVEQTPDHLAVVFEDQHLTYAELNAKANQLAHHLLSLKTPDKTPLIRPDTLVAICVERSLDMVIGLLGILKAGAAYVPIDPGYPAERIAYMLQDSAAPVLLTETRLQDRLPLATLGSAFAVMCLDALEGAAYPATNPAPQSRPDSLAYVIYTSGSTGRPKGISIIHRNVVRLVCNTNYICLGPDDRIAQASNVSFDAATFEIWGALLHGGRLVGIPKDVALSPMDLAATLRAQGITILFLTTALFNQIAQEQPAAFRTLHVLLFGGEAVNPHWVHQVLKEGAPKRFLHVYGPTETTTFATWYQIEEVPEGATTIPIGLPLANTTLYVLDSSLQPVPVGVTGELYIAGAGLARGYWNPPELTAERFIEVELFGQRERVYKTGDLARWLLDGNLEYLGRLDHQVKLRGFRIELGEIEAVLAQHAAVREAVAVLYRGDDNPRLAAYVTVGNDGEAAALPEVLKTHLQARLPDYMVPAHIQVLDNLPLTPNGKIDRKGLPAPESGATLGFKAPATPTEELLAGLWGALLKHDAPGRRDNFFALCGHSLLATQLVARIRTHFRVELLIRAVFEHPELWALAQAIDQAAGGVTLPPIVPQPAGAPKVLSFAQQRLWFLAQWEGGAAATYHMLLALQLKGTLDIEALRASLVWLLGRHESLRLCFPTVDGQAEVRVRPVDAGAALKVCDLTDLTAEAEPREVQRRADAHAVAPFEVDQGPLFKAELLVLAAERHVLLLNLHHLIGDGWSWGVLLRDWQEAYAAFLQGQPPPLPPPRLQYSDYAAWQRHWLQGEVLQAQWDYWSTQLAHCPSVLELPTDHPRPPQQSYRGAHHRQSLSGTLSAHLKRLSQEQGVTLFMTLLAAFNVLLARYSRQDDLCVGSPIANRTHHQTEDLIGFFVNTLVLRTRFEPNHSFIRLLDQTRATCLAAYAHQDLPFEALVEHLQPVRSLSHSPLFQVMFVLQNNDLPALALPGLTLEPLAQDYPVAKFDLTLSLEAQDAQLHGVWEYATDLFTADTIARMAGHFEVLLTAIVAHPEAPVHTLPLLTPPEEQQLQAWNATEADYPCDQTLVSLFEQQVAQTPDHLAVVFEDQRLTYAELNAKANQLAHHLLNLKTPDKTPLVRPDTLVAICVERSLDMVVGLLGILKAGAAYVPIDPGYPAERIAFMLDDSAAPVLLTETALQDPLAALGSVFAVMCLDAIEGAAYPATNPAPQSRPDNLAYVIHTSGSTGRPKGVMIEHSSLLNLTLAQVSAFHIDGQSRLLQFASFGFDASVSEMVTTLSSGASLFLLSKATLLSDSAFSRYVDTHALTHVTLPPSFLSTMAADRLTSLQTLIVAGEACPPDLVTRWAPGRHFINAYGPTEATVCASVFACQPNGQKPPIGRPIANTRIYLLDTQHHPLPPGIPGELCIAGAGLARGYLNRPDLTAERFIEVELFGQRERIYKTGDLARWLPDGNLEYLGRLDHQVKLRGFRIELGEIEAVLAQHAAVREAVAVLYRGDDNPRLAAYVTVGNDGEAAALPEVLKTHLQARLPDYMVPAHIQVLDNLPLTPNGKIDRKALPAPEAPSGQPHPGLPRDAVELRLLHLWETVLKIHPLGVHDNFFASGGHSLLAVKLMSHIQQEFGCRLPVSLLFAHPSIAALAEPLRNGDTTLPSVPLVPLQPQGRGLPVYGLPGAIGSVLYLYPLASHLGPQQPFYALPTPGLDGTPIPPSVPALAAYHLEALRRQQPRGPYHLVGHSSGGRVAFEMAWQLEQQGETVALLAILDATAPDPDAADETAGDTGLHRLRGIVSVLEELTGLDFGITLYTLQAQPDPEAAYALVLQTLKHHQVFFAPEAPVDELKSLVEVYRVTLDAHRDHHIPGKIRCPIHLFRASEQTAGMAFEDTREAWGWAACTDAGVEVIKVPGTHVTMMVEPQVRTLAPALAACLPAARVAPRRVQALPRKRLAR